MTMIYFTKIYLNIIINYLFYENKNTFNKKIK